jgi:hypothetical protein
MIPTESPQRSQMDGKRSLRGRARRSKNNRSYFVIVNIEESPEERTHWALVYGFR